MNNFKTHFTAAMEKIRNSKRTGMKKKSIKKDPTSNSLTTIKRNEKSYNSNPTDRQDPSSSTFASKG
jgi:hypothetical protein